MPLINVSTAGMEKGALGKEAEEIPEPAVYEKPKAMELISPKAGLKEAVPSPSKSHQRKASKEFLPKKSKKEMEELERKDAAGFTKDYLQRTTLHGLQLDIIN